MHSYLHAEQVRDVCHDQNETHWCETAVDYGAVQELKAHCHWLHFSQASELVLIWTWRKVILQLRHPAPCQHSSPTLSSLWSKLRSCRHSWPPGWGTSNENSRACKGFCSSLIQFCWMCISWFMEVHGSPKHFCFSNLKLSPSPCETLMLVTVQPICITNPPRAGIKGTDVGPAAYSTTVWPSATAPRGQKDSFWNEGGLKLDLLMCSSLQMFVH